MLVVFPSLLVYEPEFYASHDYYVFSKKMLEKLTQKYFVGDYLNLAWLVSWPKQMLYSL